MKKLEELLNIDLSKKFDTPKKLNRSSKAIDAKILEDLEAGKFTAEMIESLAATFPIFYYRSCITIHGNWPEVNTSYIGNYKNVIQNNNGSVEIKYSAIDRSKISQINDELIGTGCPFHYMENSTDRLFRIQKKVNKATLSDVRATLEPIARRLADLPVYGYLNLYIAPSLWGDPFLVLDFHLLAIRSEHVHTLVLAMSGLSEQQYIASKEAYRVKEEKEKRERDERWAIEKKEREQRAIEIEKKVKTIGTQIEALAACDDINKGILVKVFHNRSLDQYGFVYYRLDGKGSFGRLKWSKATSESFQTKNLSWEPQKQETQEWFAKLKGFRLMSSSERQVALHSTNLV